MELRFTIETGDYVKNLVGTWRAMRDAALASIDESADIFIEMMQDYIEDSSPSGREYFFRTSAGAGQLRFPLTTKKTTHGTHIASAPGEPPAVLSGSLLVSLRKRVFFSRGHTRVIAEIYSDVSYAYYLEYGTVRTGFGGPIAPRPFMAPIIFSSRANYLMLRRVRAAMERAGQGYGAR
jgi:hypothetical protein